MSIIQMGGYPRGGMTGGMTGGELPGGGMSGGGGGALISNNNPFHIRGTGWGFTQYQILKTHIFD